MSKGNKIVLSDKPRGRFLEGIIGDTSSPGTMMQIKAATVPVNGRHTWVHANVGTDGKQLIPRAILREDEYQGQLITTAYVNGTRCFLYCPLTGDECNVLLDEGAGTSNTIAIGDRFMIDSDSGISIPESGSPQETIWTALEAFTQVASPNLTWCMAS